MLSTQTVYEVPSVPAVHEGVPENWPADDDPSVHVTGLGGTIVEAFENMSFKNSEIHLIRYLIIYLLRFLAVVLVAVGLNVIVYVDDALTILFATAKIHEAAPIYIIINIK